MSAHGHSSSDAPREPFFPERSPGDVSGHAHRQLIGYLGFFLAPLLYLVAGWRQADGAKWKLLSSVSAYYHTGAVAVFAGVLASLAVFLFTYGGFENGHGNRDRLIARIAGGAAVLVAFFPTGVPEGFPSVPWWKSWMGAVHNVAAVVLFGAFAVFALSLFRKSNADPMPADKRARNRIYYASGVALLLSTLWAVVAAFASKPIFWPETLALESFALSWLVKGRALWTLQVAGRRFAHYSRHPGQLMGR